MKIKLTDQYPTRYEAFKNPGVVFEHIRPINRGGFEYLYYYKGKHGDYVGANVCSFQGTEYVVDAHACYGFEQKGFAKCFKTYREAKKVAIRKIKQLENWLQKQK